MKKPRPRYWFPFVVCVLLSVVSFTAGAQELNAIARMVLKDGTEHRGYLIDIDLSGDVWMIRPDGVVLRIPVADVKRIVRSEGRAAANDSTSAPIFSSPVPRESYQPKDGKYILQLHINPTYLGLGMGTVHGYRFNHWHQLGIGFLIDLNSTSVSFLPARHNGRQDNAGGLYFPLFVHYAGEMPNKRIRPYYSIEAGYAFNAGYFSKYSPKPSGPGGYHLASSFGLRFLTTRRYNLALAFRMSFRGLEMTFREYRIDPDRGTLIMEDNTRSLTALFLGFSIIHSFGR